MPKELSQCYRYMLISACKMTTVINLQNGGYHLTLQLVTPIRF